ncbi:hypothetical protein D1872_291430 [compost metagenome]
MMCSVHCRYQHDIWLHLRNHAFELMCLIGRHCMVLIFIRQQMVRKIHACLIHITERHELGGLLKGRDQFTIKKFRSSAGSYNRIALLRQGHHSSSVLS